MNNFDMSSTGYNIELLVFKDQGISIRDFEENFDLVSGNSFSLLNDRYHGVNIYAYQLPDFDLWDLDNWTLPSKKDLYNLILNNLFNGCINSLNTETKDQFNKYSYQLTKQELLEFLKDTYTPDYQDFIVTHFTFKMGIVSSLGYSQGDYVEVIYDKNDFNGDPDFDSEIWDCPIYARLEVNDQEFYLDEYLKDSYDYDQEDLESIISKVINESDFKDKDLIISQVISMLPTQLDYK